MITKRDGDTPRVIQKISFLDNEIPRPIRRVTFKDGATDRVTFEASETPMAVACTPSVSNNFSIYSALIESGQIDAVVTGGTAPFLYAWTILSHSAPEAPIISQATSANTVFTQHGIFGETTETATAQVMVTDVLGQTATDTVDLSFTRFDFGGIFS